MSADVHYVFHSEAESTLCERPWIRGTTLATKQKRDVTCERCLRIIAVSRHPAGKRLTGPCSCACNSGGFCGGCGHAGCGGRR